MTLVIPDELIQTTRMFKRAWESWYAKGPVCLMTKRQGKCRCLSSPRRKRPS